MSDEQVDAIIAEALGTPEVTETEVETTEEEVSQTEPAEENKEADDQKVKSDDEPEIDFKAEYEKLQAKINRQKGANSAQNRKIQELTAEIEALRASVKTGEDGRPREEDYSDAYEFAKDLGKWEAAQELKQKALDEANRAQAQEQAKRQVELEIKARDFAKIQEEYKTANPDYEANAQNLNNFLGQYRSHPAVHWLTEQIIDHGPKGVELVNYLGGNELALYKLASMPIPEMQEAIIDLLDGFSTPAKKQVTLPKQKPIKPVTGGGKAEKTLDDMTGEEIIKKLGIR